jgi:hypothetical protein
MLASQPAAHDLQASKRDCRESEYRMQRAAEAAADRNCDNRSRQRQGDRKYQPVFVNAEPPPLGVPDRDLAVEAGQRGLRFTETDGDDADRNQYEPDRDHQDGVIIPMNRDGHPQKVKMRFRWNVCCSSEHCHLHSYP